MKLIRETYLSKIRPFYDSNIIKVITGIRRCGKSYLLESIKDELSMKGIDDEHIVYINLEDIDYSYIETAEDLNSEVKGRLAKQGKTYVFLDEIQHVIGFEKALASLRATQDVSLFVTGSNSTLLSGELATLLTGRTIEIEILPFSFSEMKEFYEINNREWNDDYIYDYLKWGGFPQRFDYEDDASTLRYLENLYNGIVNRDIVSNKHTLERRNFVDISLYILANSGKELSIENLVNVFADEGKSISKRTIYNYLKKMKKSYLIHGVGRYNISGKSALRNREKQYAIDMGLRTINTNTIEFEDTFFIENVIFNELISRGNSVYSGKTRTGEVDFVAINDGKKCFIQVAYLLASDSTIKREFGAFKNIKDSCPKYVLSLDRLDFSRDGIEHMNIVDFLLHRKRLHFS